MNYDTAIATQRESFLMRCQHLAGKGAKVELTEKTVRSLSQNAYLHLCLGVVAMECGVSIEYAKTEYFKRLVNPSIFVVSRFDRIFGRNVETLRSSAELSKEELSTALDSFKRWAADNGMYIPDPFDKERLAEVQFQLDRMKAYM